MERICLCYSSPLGTWWQRLIPQTRANFDAMNLGGTPKNWQNGEDLVLQVWAKDWPGCSGRQMAWSQAVRQWPLWCFQRAEGWLTCPAIFPFIKSFLEAWVVSFVLPWSFLKDYFWNQILGWAHSFRGTQSPCPGRVLALSRCSLCCTTCVCAVHSSSWKAIVGCWGCPIGTE